MATAVGYIRVSTDQQVEEGLSLEAQEQKIRAWADLHEVRVIQVFSDEGMSGYRADNRPGLAKAMDAACANGAALVVYSLSRLGRNLVDLIQLSERLAMAEADLVSLTERIDTTTAAGKMIFGILCVLAEFERNLTSERTREAMQLKKIKGENTGTVPYGQDLGDDGKTLVANSSERLWIGKMASWRATGKSYREIARRLTDGEVRGKSGSKSWTHSTVACILNRHDAALRESAARPVPDAG